MSLSALESLLASRNVSVAMHESISLDPRPIRLQLNARSPTIKNRPGTEASKVCMHAFIWELKIAKKNQLSLPKNINAYLVHAISLSFIIICILDPHSTHNSSCLSFFGIGPTLLNSKYEFKLQWKMVLIDLWLYRGHQ